MKIKITDRDLEIMRWIARLKHLNTTLISEFFFDGSVKATQKRLRLLSGAGYLCWFEKLSPSSIGRCERIYYLNKKLKDEIKYLLNQDVIIYSPPKNPVFANHDLKIAHFILCLKDCCEKNTAYSFHSEVENRSKFLKRNLHKKDGLPIIGRSKAVFIPDSLIVLKSKKGKSLTFLEVDTGKETIRGSFKNTADLSRKMKAYADYLSCKGYKALSEQFNFSFTGFRVLLVTTPKRVEKISTLCEHIDTKGVVWITSFDRVTPKILFDPVWHVPEEKNLMSIIKKKE